MLCAVLLAGCRGSGGPATASQRPPRLDAEQRYQRGYRVVTSYLQALVAGRPVDGWAAPRTEAERRSLLRLTRTLAAVPIGELAVDTHPLDLPSPMSGVVATLNATLGPPPSTGRVLLGQFVLAARSDEHGRWWVAADITSQHRTILNQKGLLSLSGLRYSVGSSSVVVDATGHREFSFGARVAQRTADEELPALNARYGGPRRALIVVVPDSGDVGLLVPRPPHIDSAAVTWQGRIILVEAPWTDWGDPGAQGVVVHELTHLVTERWMDGAPASLAEGLAAEEQNRYLRRQGSFMPLGALARAYRRGYPTLTRWEWTTTGWGLADGAAVDLAYDDAHAMVHTVLSRHGGLPALRRLAARFTRLGGPLAFGPAQVRTAFRTGLGVPFATVAREARKWVWSRSWSRVRGGTT